jgi:hypothetical protein
MIMRLSQLEDLIHLPVPSAMPVGVYGSATRAGRDNNITRITMQRGGAV